MPQAQGPQRLNLIVGVEVRGPQRSNLIVGVEVSLLRPGFQPSTKTIATRSRTPYPRHLPAAQDPQPNPLSPNDPNPRRPILLPGLVLALSRPGAVLWTYAANLLIALLFALRLRFQLASLLDHSLAGQSLTAQFDLGTALTALERTTRDVPSSSISSYLGIPVYLAIYFLLVPGTLFIYRVPAPARLSILLSAGVRFFWRFIRISLLTLLISAATLIPCSAAASAWASFIDQRMVGAQALWLQALGWLAVLLVAALLRLYFDLVEVYTVQLDDHLLPPGFPDRRVRRTLLPALRTLGSNLPRIYVTFLTILVLGLAAFVFFTRVAAHTLAKPTSLPVFFLAQTGIVLMLFTRFWQRAAETILATDNPLPEHALQPHMAPDPTPQTPKPPNPVPDPIPDPEPASPSLPRPDPGIFHPS